MFATDGSGAGDERGQFGAVGGHGMPNSCIEKEFGGIKGVRRNDVQDALFNLTVFPGAQPQWPLVVVSGVPWSDKFGDDDFQTGVEACLPEEHGKQVCNGLVNPVDATTSLAR